MTVEQSCSLATPAINQQRPLRVKALPAVINPACAPHMVLLHGWGASSIVWQGWLSGLQQYCNLALIDLPGYGANTDISIEGAAQLAEAIVEVAPAQAIYLGYSLGGMLAVDIANRFPQRVRALITLASNCQFVASEGWPNAMDATTFDAFSALVAKKPAMALKRFAGLQSHGASNEKPLLKQLRDNKEVVSEPALSRSLEWLSHLDNTQALHNISLPALHIFAENDHLVPVLAAKQLQQLLPTNVVIIDGAPHCLFQSHRQQSWQLINEFLAQQQLINIEKNLDKSQVARSFSRAASSYDSVAALQRQVGGQLLQLLPEHSPQRVLDLGCGTGYFCSALQAQYPQAQLIGLDLAEGMVKHAASNQQASWLCADAESLPLASQSIDIIYSSLAIQWCEQEAALFSEIYRVLKPGGVCVFSTLGPESLHELRLAWSAVDDYVHVNRFIDRPQLITQIQLAGFEPLLTEITQEQIITLEYKELRELTRELKSLGAHNINAGRPEGLTGKQRMQTLINAYELQRNEQGLLPASYQVWYGALQKPEAAAAL